MEYRIIYCALGCASILANLQHDPLRKSSSGTVEALSDEVIAVLLMKDPNVPLLFFSRNSYDEALKGLSDKESESVVQKRLERWSPEALDHAVEWIARGERRILTLTARGRRQATGSIAQELGIHFDSSLDLLASLVSAGRYDEMNLADLLSAAVEKETLLIAELGTAPEARTRTEFASALAQALRRYGRPEFAQALPYAEPARGAWVVPADREVTGFLQLRGEPGIPWRGGMVASLPLRTIQEFQKSGKRVKILYPDAGAFQQDATELSEAQMNRRLDQLNSADDAALQSATADYVNMLRLDLALLRRALRLRAVKDLALAPVLESQISMETSILEQELARTGSWLSSSDQGTLAPRIKVAEEEVSADVKFFALATRIRGNSDLSRRLDAIAARKRADLERISNLRINPN